MKVKKVQKVVVHLTSGSPTYTLEFFAFALSLGVTDLTAAVTVAPSGLLNPSLSRPPAHIAAAQHFTLFSFVVSRHLVIP